jgi:hypothetical protein
VIIAVNCALVRIVLILAADLDAEVHVLESIAPILAVGIIVVNNAAGTIVLILALV